MDQIAQAGAARGSTRQFIGSNRTRWITTAILVFGAAVTIFPFIWMLLGSFKTLIEGLRFPPTFLP
ncbi:MAG TPA: hypothetical protein VFQ54_01135, partial [Thermomicrobiales bacterium]|nr:hypothetical protein [Thermomicrobiales bacterium]